MADKRRPLVPLVAGVQVVAYCRESGGPGEDRSIAQQRQELSAYADAQGYHVTHWFVDEARSGATDDRPQFQEMIALCRSDAPPVAVLVWSLSRFGRNDQDGPYYRADLRRHGVEVVSVGQPIPTGPMSGMYEAMLDWHNASVLDDLRRDVRRGQMAVLRQGFVLGGVPPVGYRAVQVPLPPRRDGSPRHGVHWEIDEATAPRVRQAFEMRANGASLAEIHAATHLHHNIPGYSAMFARPTYRGIYTYGDLEFPIVPALVDAATWQAAYERRQQRRPPRTVSSSYLLSGLATCGYCGQRIHGCSRRENRRAAPATYYRCTGKTLRACPSHFVRADVIDRAVIARVLQDALNPETTEAVIAAAQARAAATDYAAPLVELEGRIQAIEQAIVRLVDLAEHGAALTEVRARIRQRESELAKLRSQYAKLATEQSQANISAETLRQALADLATDLQSVNVPLARRALAKLVATVTLQDYDVTIHYR
jgi:site-specific DNA recombinase